MKNVNLLEQRDTVKQMFAKLAKGAESYNVTAKGIKKDIETFKDAVLLFDTLCECSQGELTIISTNMHSMSIYVQFSYFKGNEVVNQVQLEANFY